MKKKTIVWMLGAALIALFAAACGSAAEPAPTATSAPATEPAEPTEAEVTEPTEMAAVCGRTEPDVILVLLVDTSKGQDGGVLRASRLVEADFPARQVRSLTIPRALLVKSEAVVDDEQTLEALYATVAQGEPQAPVEAGSQAVSAGVGGTLGLQPEHYVTLDFAELAGIIDAVGGADVEIGQEFDATAYGLPHFTPGTMHMEGDLAVAYATTPTGGGRWSGLRRQTEVLKALRKSALQPSILPQLPELIGRFRDAVTTDMTIEAGLDFACLANEVEVEEVTFRGIDESMVSERQDGALEPEMDQVAELLADTFTTYGP